MGNKPGSLPLGKSMSKGAGLGGGRGGRGAGMMPAPFTPEEKNLKVTRQAPNTRISGTRSTLKNPGLTLTTRGDPQAGGHAGTPYYQVYTRQKRVAESAVDRENIPAPYRKQVKDYFENIKP